MQGDRRLGKMSARSALCALALLALLALAAGCGGDSGEGGEGGDSGASAAEGDGASSEGGSASIVPYDGPEKGLPTEFPEPSKTGQGDCTIGFQNIYAAIPSQAQQQKGAEAEAEALGCDLVVLDDQLDPTKQVNNFNQLLAQNVDAIVVYPIVPEALGPSISQAQGKGIPVVATSTPPAASDPLPEGYDVRVLQGFDSSAYGRAKFIAETSPGAKFVVLGLAQPVASLQYLAKRSIYWGEKMGLEFLGEVDAQEDNPSSASTAMSGILGKYSDVEAVLAYNDNTAVAAGSVAKASQSDALICGADGQSSAFQAIESGSIACTSLADFVGLGEQLVRGAYDLLTEQGGKLPETVLTEQTLIDESNVGDFEPFD